MPFDNSLTLLVRRIVVFFRNPSALARSKRGWTPATKSRAWLTRIQRGSTATSERKQTSRIRCSRSLHGSRPSTRSSPSKAVSPRIALSAVVLPAPLGPMSPRIRPSSTRRSTPSSATVVPNALRRPCASIVAITSFPLCTPLRGRGIEFLLGQAKPLNLLRDPGPFLGEKFLAFAFQQQSAGAGFDEHAETAPHLDQLFVDQLLIGFQHG